MKRRSFTDEHEVLQALQEGSEDAFVHIYELYWYDLFLTAYRRVRKKEVAQELVQNLFLKVWEKRESLHIQNLKAYLFASIRHAVIDYINSQLTVNNYLEYCSVFTSVHEATTEKMVQLQEVSEALEDGLSRLPEKSQQVFRLSRLNHWPVGKIAVHLNLSEKTVQYHLTKSLKFLRSYLKEFTYILLVFLAAS